MPVEVTPSGTRGGSPPKVPKMLRAILFPVVHLFLKWRGMKLLTLTTIGARSGNEHSVPLSYFPEGDEAWLVIASSGGSAKHPAWFFNMARNPDRIWVKIGDRSIRVNAESLTGEARDTTWRRIAVNWPLYASYEQKSDRVFPVVRLTPA